MGEGDGEVGEGTRLPYMCTQREKRVGKNARRRWGSRGGDAFFIHVHPKGKEGWENLKKKEMGK